MGAWGTAIFSDDVAADVRDAFTGFIAEGLTASEATDRLLAESSELLEDEDAATVFWLALAATQWRLGRLLDPVRDRALRIIDSGDDLRRWQQNTNSEIDQRRKHLAKLREQLLHPQPKPRKLRPFLKSSTDFRPGDVAAFRLDDCVAVRFCVLHLWGDRDGTYADICLLGLEDGTPFSKSSLSLPDTLGPHFTMLSREPPDRVTILHRGVSLPERNSQACREWNNLTVKGGACTWDQFPDALRDVFRELGWWSSNKAANI